ncbi:MAG: glucuronate isomerase [Propionibacteriaceae bacterium]|nr:glucuronate isomerase [Propionibacteriaceae bacterium]
MFLDDDFLLTTPTAKQLFRACKDLPIIDYHCHLNPSEIAADATFASIVEVWLGGRTPTGGLYGDHYKWRLMRANGVPERLITGDAPDWDKFEAFAATMEKAVGNPVYLWTHLELRRIFGITAELTRDSARAIFDQANELLATPEFSRRGLIRRSNVAVVCTTDDPIDDLRFHRQLVDEPSFRVVPAFRPDRALAIARPDFPAWLAQLEDVSGVRIGGFADLVTALATRADVFAALGARLSDHALDGFRFQAASPDDLDAILARALDDPGALTPAQADAYRTGLLVELARLYHDRGWTMQLHVHADRDANRARAAAMGADVGFDAMADGEVVAHLAGLFNAEPAMPRTIVYSLNPADWMPLTALMGCFQGDIEQRLSLGCAWWFNDTRSGIAAQLTTLAEQSLLGNFVGMTTDSRSFLSYPRHEYFRRILCELVGQWAERGEITNDSERLCDLVRNVSYFNARRLFGF